MRNVKRGSKHRMYRYLIIVSVTKHEGSLGDATIEVEFESLNK